MGSLWEWLGTGHLVWEGVGGGGQGHPAGLALVYHRSAGGVLKESVFVFIDR